MPRGPTETLVNDRKCRGWSRVSRVGRDGEYAWRVREEDSGDTLGRRTGCCRLHREAQSWKAREQSQHLVSGGRSFLIEVQVPEFLGDLDLTSHG